MPCTALAPGSIATTAASSHLLFAEDAEVDFGPCGRKMGVDFPVLRGGATIVGFLAANARAQTTSHVITSGRVGTDGNAAKLSALVDRTHPPKGDHSRHCRMVNWYAVSLVQAGVSGASAVS